MERFRRPGPSPLGNRADLSLMVGFAEDFFSKSKSGQATLLSVLESAVSDDFTKGKNGVVATPRGDVDPLTLYHIISVIKKISNNQTPDGKAQYKDSEVSDYGFPEYQHDLGFRVEDLGDYVADLGAGVRSRFARDAEAIGITVIGINPLLSLKAQRNKRRRTKILKRKIRDLPPATASTSSNLPLRDESMSSVVSHFGLSYFAAGLISLEEAVASYREVYRILQPGGSAYIGPYRDDELVWGVAHIAAAGLTQNTTLHDLQSSRGLAFSMRITKPILSSRK